jgi:probable rRNA maturation factor
MTTTDTDTDTPSDTERPAPEIDLSDSQSHLRLDPEWVRGLARRALGLEGIRGGTLSIAVVDDPAILEVNRKHLGHDWPTDVISFLFSEPGDPDFSGELVISAEMAASVAGQCGLDPMAEFALYLVHGLLHLCGYDDRTDEERARMRAREDEVLSLLGISPPPRGDLGAGTGPSGREGGL